MPINIGNYFEMVKSFLNPEKWLFEINPKTDKNINKTDNTCTN